MCAEISDDLLLHFPADSDAANQVVILLSFVPFCSDEGHAVDSTVGHNKESMGLYDSLDHDPLSMWIMIHGQCQIPPLVPVSLECRLG